jgi:hypothetical protein
MKKSILLPVSLILLTMLLCPSIVYAKTFNSSWTTSTPTIDGILSLGEWDDATAQIVPMYFYADQSFKFNIVIWLMNSEDNLFVLAQWTDDISGSNKDWFRIYFDEDNNKNFHGVNENAVDLSRKSGDSQGTFRDGTCPSGFSLVVDALEHGDGEMVWVANTWTLEMFIPIGSSDLADINSGAGSLIGVAIHYINGTSGQDYFNPADCYIAENSTTLQLASAPSNIGIPHTILFCLLGLIGIVFYASRKKSKNAPVQTYL